MPRWTERVDDAVRAAGEGRERPGAGSAWPSVVCPDRGTISGDDAKKRWNRIKARQSAPAPARQTRRTPIAQRAANAGVNINPTPPDVRDIIADRDAPTSAVANAQRQLRKHQKNVQKTVSRAEAMAAQRKRAREAREERQERFEIWQRQSSTDCPGLRFEESSLELMHMYTYEEPTPEERAREGRHRRFFNWLDLRQSQWRRRWKARRQELAVEGKATGIGDDETAIAHYRSTISKESFAYECRIFTGHVLCRAFELMRLNDDARSGRPFGRRPITVSANDLHDPFFPSLWEDYHLRHPQLHARMQKKNNSRLLAARSHETWEEAAIAEMIAAAKRSTMRIEPDIQKTHRVFFYELQEEKR